MHCKDTLLKMLKNSHAMEKSLEEAFNQYAETANGMPEVAQVYRDWANVAMEHAEKLEQKIEDMGNEVSGTMEWLSKMMGKSTDISLSFPDENLKNAAFSHAMGHMGMASYTATKMIAEKCGGHPEIGEMSSQFSDECSEYAEKIEEKMPMIIDNMMTDEEEMEEEEEEEGMM